MFDPPKGWKTVDEADWPSLTWQMVWINDSNTTALNAFVVDAIPAGTQYIANSLTCTGQGATVVHACTYNAAQQRIEVTADIAPDPGATDETQAANELVIRFRTTVRTQSDQIRNQGEAFWDENGDGVVNSADANVAQHRPVYTDDPAQPGAADPTVAQRPALPQTGFAPGRTTWVGVRPAHLPYAQLGSIWLEIPRLGVRRPILGVPQGANLAWLHDVGWLWNSPFPGWAGNSVLTAHNYTADGLPGPFVGLRRLRWNDVIRVHAFGLVYEFRVRRHEFVTPTATWPIENVHDGYAWLTLITCASWDESHQRYRQREVVRAVLMRWWAEGTRDR